MMILLRFLSALSLHLVLLTLCALASAAPAHHLTIGVQGNTPTLFVTSSEIGISSETERSRIKMQKPHKEFKPNDKSKYQKTKQSANYKKGKGVYFAKSVVAAPLSAADAFKINRTEETPPPSFLVVTHTPVSSYSQASTTATTVTSDRQTTYPPTTTSIAIENSAATTESIFKNNNNVQQSKESTTTENLAFLFGTMPPRTEGLTANPPTESSIEATATLLSTGLPLISDTTDVATTTAEADLTKDDEVLNVTNKQNNYKQSNATPLSTTAVSPDDASISTQSSFTSERTTEPQDETLLGSDVATSSIQTPLQSPVTQMLSSVSSNPTSSSTDAIIKLMDLEKHNAKSSLESLGHQSVGHDNGHDGLKNIRKKQLVETHFLDIVAPNVKLEDTGTEDISTITPTRHPFLGPILMEEKTFHVIHGNTTSTANTNHHSMSAKSQLRHSNFVEIKPSKIKGELSLKAEEAILRPTTSQLISTADVAKDQRYDNDDETTVLSSTTFEVGEIVASKTPSKPSNSFVTSTKNGGNSAATTNEDEAKMSESKISDIQIEVYDSTIDSIVASTNFKDIPQGKTTKPPGSAAQQERFTQYVIDRTETSTQESINFSTIQVASGIPEPAAIEIHINVSESFSNDNEDPDVLFPQTDYNSNTGHVDDVYDDVVKEKDEVKLKAPSNTATKDRSDEILVVEIMDNADNNSTDVKVILPAMQHTEELHSTPPPPPPPPPYQGNFERDSDTIFYISNTEVKVGESPPTSQKAYDERKLKLENQFFPANYMASTHPNVADDVLHHLYEEDIILSSDRNQADSLKIYRNRNEPSPPLDVTYVGESIIEVEQSPDTGGITTTLTPDHVITPQPDVIIQPAILPEISIGVPVIGELPPQIELKEIDYMPNEAQIHRSAGYGNDDSNGNTDNRLDDSSIQYGGDLIDESADGGFDGIEGSYPFGNPEQRKQSHVGDYAHLYINYGVNNMRKDELSADIKDSGEVSVIVGNSAGNVIEQNLTAKEFMNRVSFNNNITGLNESERMSNVTAFSIMEDPNDLEEKNTEDIINLISLAIGLFIVILPVVVTCSMLWALRYLYKKYHSTSTDSNGNLDPTDGKGLPSDDAAEKGECAPESCSPSHSDKDDIQKCPETFNESSIDNGSVKFSAEHPTHVDSSVALHCKIYSSSSKCRDYPLLLPLNTAASNDIQTTVHDESPPGPNGSITKMTLENNLLIVETEERNDISRVARETKMDYNKDGVFVVEVSRGIDSRTIPESPVTDGPEKMLSMFEPKHNGNMAFKLSNEKVSHNNEKVQIHSPPPEKTHDEGPRSLHQIEEVDEPGHSPRQSDDPNEETDVLTNYKSNTGLSQSDLSSTSSNDSNKDYCYGNQELYVVEQSGYGTSSPTVKVVLKCDTKDIQDDDQNSENGPYLEHSPRKEEETRAAEDILDTVNRTSETKTFDEKQKVQGGGKKTKNEVEIGENKETEEKSSHDVVTCNGHANDDGLPAESSIAEETKPLNISAQSNSNEVLEKSMRETEILEKSAANLGELDVPEVENEVNYQLPMQEPPKDLENVLLLENGSNDHKAMATQPLEDIPEGIPDEVTVSPPQTNGVAVAIECDNNKSHSKCLEVVLEEPLNQTEDSFESDEDHHIHFNGLLDTPPDEKVNGHQQSSNILKEIHLNTNGDDEDGAGDGDGDDDGDVDDKSNGNPKKHMLLTNGIHILPDVVPSGKVSLLITNGNTNCDVSSNCQTELENGYDSIMSLPDPPTSDEIFSGDMSEQQLDSLPPPPPPPPPPPMLNELNGETFNLKDLPPPLTNCETVCLANEDSNNYYATLPPPPPTTTTLDISSANTHSTNGGNMHNSPLTPPASPPPHFSNGLHTVMCPPIAVDVNGS